MEKERDQKLKVEFASNALSLEEFCRLLSLAIGEKTLNQLRSEAIKEQIQKNSNGSNVCTT